MDKSHGSNTWIYHVVMPLTAPRFLSRLQAMEDWLSEWEIPYEVVPLHIGDTALLIRFPTEDFAHAFIAVEKDMARAALPGLH
ncbi:hypothetical protein AB4099_34725 [Bosea sp. 2KB_26]|uniref:hypothetical protein n=1 Tax=Bosea sp. 2KB_26 TaxID=3237475 RepID=UPI003F914675